MDVQFDFDTQLYRNPKVAALFNGWGVMETNHDLVNEVIGL